MVKNGQNGDVVSSSKTKKTLKGKKKLHDLRQLSSFSADVSTGRAVDPLPLNFNDCQEYLAL